MAQIRVNDLTFCYDGSWDNVFTHLSFSVDTDWRLGLVGRNGRGKTTLLRLLEGSLDTGGAVHSPTAFSYFPFEIADDAALCSEIADVLSDGALQWKLLREMGLLGLSEELLWRPYNTLSGGERTKLQLAALFLRENNFLLIDEPTNHLDAEGRRLLEQYLAQKKGFILVSHDRRFLDASVDHIMALNPAGIDVVQGNFSQWFENKQRRDAFERSENERLQRDIERISAASRRTGSWADRAESAKYGHGGASGENKMGLRPYMGEKSRKMQAQRKAMEKRSARAIEEKSALLKNLEKAEELKITPLAYYKDRMAETDGLSLYYGERCVCHNIRFAVNRGDRIALTGANGSGKSTLLKLLCGEEIRHEGRLLVGSGLKISVVQQDSSFLSGSVYDYAETCGADLTRFLTILRKLDFPREQFEKDMAAFSRGQQKKVLLARSLAEDAHLYIWDEPLNYIDLFSRMQLEQLLQSAKPTILFVEHDAAFCEAIANKMLRL